MAPGIKDAPHCAKNWTTEGLIDELAFCLCSVHSCNVEVGADRIYIYHKYYDKAEWLLYRVNIWKPPPEFVINVSDLTLPIRKQLKDLKSTPEALDHIVTEAICRILESVNSRYFYLCCARSKLRWRFED